MKKIALVLSTLFLITGCSLFSSIGIKDSLTGVLSEQKSGDEMKGTHVLTEDGGTVYPLNSTVLNLSSPQYLGNEVTVQVAYDKNTEIYTVSGISVLKILEKNGQMVNWKTYMHQGLGFKLKYYDNWGVEDYYVSPSNAVANATVAPQSDLPPGGDNYVRFVAPLQSKLAVVSATPSDTVAPSTTVVPSVPATSVAPDYVGVKLLDNKDKKTLDVFIKDKFLEVSTTSYDTFLQSDAKVGVSQQAAKEFKSKLTSEVIFFVQRDESQVYALYFEPVENFNNNNERTFYEMLAEFQTVPFGEGAATTTPSQDAIDSPTTPNTPATPSTTDTVTAPSSAKTYDYTSFSDVQSSAFKFQFKIPSRWYYDGSAKSGDRGVEARYLFSDKPVTPENTFARLEFTTYGKQIGGTKISLPNGEGLKVTIDDDVEYNVTVGGKVYVVSGKKTDEATLEAIAASISPLTIAPTTPAQ